MRPRRRDRLAAARRRLKTPGLPPGTALTLALALALAVTAGGCGSGDGGGAPTTEVTAADAPAEPAAEAAVPDTDGAHHGHRGPRLGRPPAGADPELAAVCAGSTATDDPYFGLRPLEQLKSQWQAMQGRADVPATDRIRLLVVMSERRLRIGQIAEARADLAQARELAAGLPSAPPGLWPGLLMQSAVAALRRAEDENCRAGYGPESCIAPLAGGGVHVHPDGALEARGFLEQMLQQRPQDEVARYLLNLVHMALGTWPDGVPAAFRTAPGAFKSDADIGRFFNVAPERGVDVWSLAGGVVLDDLDGDHDLDLMVSDWDPCAPLALFLNDGSGHFTDHSSDSGVASQLGGLNLEQADYDNDGDKDVLVLRGGWQGGSPLGRQRNSLLENLGDGRFEDVTRRAGLAEPSYPTQSAAWADYDLDGDLDLYVCNEGTSVPGGVREMSPGQLFQNDGKGAFKDVSFAAGVRDLGYCKGVAWGDADNDGAPDLYLSIYNGPNRLFYNLGDGTFREAAAAAGVTGPPGSFPVWFWDVDNDGWLDLFVGAFDADTRKYMSEYLGTPVSEAYARVYRNLGNGRFEDVSGAMGTRRVQMLMGANYGDLDNDGWLDFHGGVGSPNFEALFANPMMRNDGGRRFQDVTFSGGFGHLQKGHGIAFGDIDEDGDQDVYAEIGAAFADDSYGNALYLNPGHGRRWLKLELEGVTANRDAVGARVAVSVRRPDGSLRELHRVVDSGGSFGADPMRVELGLDDAVAVESVTVRWPAPGAPRETFSGVEPDAAWRLVQGRGAAERLR